MTRETMLAALDRLAVLLEKSSLTVHVHAAGGAALSLLSVRRPDTLTRDVDVMEIPKSDLIENAIARVAKEMSLDNNWFNDKMGDYLDPYYVEKFPKQPVYNKPSLMITSAPPKLLLALKMRALRPENDFEDIALLMEHLGMESVHDAIDVLREVFPSKIVPFETFNELRDYISGRNASNEQKRESLTGAEPEGERGDKDDLSH